MDWINPGYVPKAYEEFCTPTAEACPGGRKIDVRRLDRKEGPLVELTDGTSSILIEKHDLAGVIRRLQAAAGQSPE